MKKKKYRILVLALILAAAAAAAGILFWRSRGPAGEEPGEVLRAYMNKISEGDYQGMYGLLDEESHSQWSLEEFTERNQNIYEGIGFFLFLF